MRDRDSDEREATPCNLVFQDEASAVQQAELVYTSLCAASASHAGFPGFGFDEMGQTPQYSIFLRNILVKVSSLLCF
jgi:hypothetical protein